MFSLIDEQGVFIYSDKSLVSYMYCDVFGSFGVCVSKFSLALLCLVRAFLVAVRGGSSSRGVRVSRCAGLSGCGAQLWGARAPFVAVHGLGISAACGIFLDQGSNLCLPLWREDSYPLYYQGSPSKSVIVSVIQKFFILVKVYLSPSFWIAHFAFYFSTVLPTPRSYRYFIFHV